MAGRKARATYRGDLAAGSALLAHHLGEQAAFERGANGARTIHERTPDGAKSADSTRHMAQALHHLGQLARVDGDAKRAAELHHEALHLHSKLHDAAAIATSLEAIGGLAREAGRYQHAARLFAAARTIREANGFELSRDSHYEADLGLVRQSLAAEELEVAWAQGAELTTEAAVALASKGRGARPRAARDWPSLTPTERRVAALVAEGLTNPEIASKLVIAPATVKTHVTHIFRKLGVARRSELVREYPHHERELVDPEDDDRIDSGPEG